MRDTLAFGCYYGEKVRELAIAGLALSECTYLPEQTLASHTHEYAYLCLVLRGSYTETSGRHTSVCSSDLLILHPQGEQHSDRFHARGGHLFNVDLGREWTRRILAQAPVLDRRIEIAGGPPSYLMQKLYQEFRCNDSFSPLAIEGLTLELLALLARQSLPAPGTAPPLWLTQARDLLHSHYLHDWTLADIAAELGVHPTHLARLFRRHYRCTVGEYVRQLRVQFASTQLRETATPLAEIAQQAGFADQSHFSRLFKRYYGVSPAVYRADHAR